MAWQGSAASIPSMGPWDPGPAAGAEPALDHHPAIGHEGGAWLSGPHHNSYIIRNDPVLRQAALEKGVHQLIGYDGIVMTDSGTFQKPHVWGGRARQ